MVFRRLAACVPGNAGDNTVLEKPGHTARLLVITPPMERAGTGLPGYDLPHPCPSPKMGGESIEPWHEMGGEGDGRPFQGRGLWLFVGIVVYALFGGGGEEGVDAVETFAAGGGVAACGTDGVFVFEEGIEMPIVAVEDALSIRHFP